MLWLVFIFILLIIFATKDWFIHYFKLLQTYGSIPCPPNRLPFLGSLLHLPLDPASKKNKFNDKNIIFFSYRIHKIS
jgi:hypothetical protein